MNSDTPTTANTEAASPAPMSRQVRRQLERQAAKSMRKHRNERVLGKNRKRGGYAPA